MTTRILLESKSSNDPESQYQPNRFLRNCFAQIQILSKVLPRFVKHKEKPCIKSLESWFQFFFGSSCQPKKRTPPGLKRFPGHPWAPHDARPSGRRVSSWTEVLWANHGGRWGAFSEVWKMSRFSPFEGLMITYPFFLDSDCVCGVLGLFFQFFVFFRTKCFFLYVGHPRLRRLHVMLSRINLEICRFYIEQHDFRWFFQEPFEVIRSVQSKHIPTPAFFHNNRCLLAMSGSPKAPGFQKMGHPRVGKEGSWDNTLTFWMVDAFLFWHFEVTWVNHANEKWKWKNWWRDLLDLKDGTGSWKMEVCLEKS